MPKYYCQSGNFKTVLMADNKEDAIRKMLIRAIDKKATLSLISGISEKGFNLSSKPLICSNVPFLKEMNFPLPDNNEIIRLAAESLNKNIDDLDDEYISWLFGE